MKYRGKQRIDNHRWYYGDAFRNIHAAYIITKSIDKGEYFCVKVVPETVTKCTDYVDINGVDIYEGDIINIRRYDTYACEQDEKAFYALETKHGLLCELTKSKCNTIEVVGSKWDNPYLLERCVEVI